MTSDELLELTAEMKRLGVIFFEFKGAKIAFDDRKQPGNSGHLFTDQQAMIDELQQDDVEEIDPSGKQAVANTLSDEDIFASAE